MALVKCDDCGTQVSSSAMKCPKCGALTKKMRSLLWQVPLAIVCLYMALKQPLTTWLMGN